MYLDRELTLVFMKILIKDMMGLQDMKSLSNVVVMDCMLDQIPEEFSGLSALTSLDLHANEFNPQGMWEWWPITLSR
jgi:hypothetical protein